MMTIRCVFGLNSMVERREEKKIRRALKKKQETCWSPFSVPSRWFSVRDFSLMIHLTHKSASHWLSRMTSTPSSPNLCLFSVSIPLLCGIEEEYLYPNPGCSLSLHYFPKIKSCKLEQYFNDSESFFRGSSFLFFPWNLPFLFVLICNRTNSLIMLVYLGFFSFLVNWSPLSRCLHRRFLVVCLFL